MLNFLIEPDETIIKRTDDVSFVAAVNVVFVKFYGLSFSHAEILADIGSWSKPAK